MPGAGPTTKVEEKTLLEIFERLTPAQQDMLISFAEFLTTDGEESDATLDGRSAREVVADLEVLFERHYRKIRE